MADPDVPSWGLHNEVQVAVLLDAAQRMMVEGDFEGAVGVAEELLDGDPADVDADGVADGHDTGFPALPVDQHVQGLRGGPEHVHDALGSTVHRHTEAPVGAARDVDRAGLAFDRDVVLQRGLPASFQGETAGAAASVRGAESASNRWIAAAMLAISS